MEAATHPPPPRRHRRRKQQKKTQDHTITATNATTISELPSHITCDILSRLPLNSIFTCKRVCSSFRNLTLDPYFPQLHLPRSSLSLILFHRLHRTISFGFLPLNDYPNLRRRRATVKFKTEIEFPRRALYTVSCCNGLLCLTDYSLPDTIYICNPITRQHFLLPKPKNDQIRCGRGYGFGYCRLTDLYKVVKFTRSYEKLPQRLHCSIYTLGVDDEWRTLGDAGLPFPDTHPFVFLNGALHWISSEDSFLRLCYFDLEKEQGGNFPLPNLHVPSLSNPTRYHLGVVDNCLYISNEQTSPLPVNIWVMKDYGDIGSWNLEWIIQRPLPTGLDQDLKPVKTLDDGTVLITVRKKILASYNPVTRVFQKITYHGVRLWEDSVTGVPSFLPLP